MVDPIGGNGIAAEGLSKEGSGTGGAGENDYGISACTAHSLICAIIAECEDDASLTVVTLADLRHSLQSREIVDLFDVH